MSDEKKVPAVNEPAPESASRARTRAALKAIAEKLERTEKTTGRSGAVSRLPKQRMYDISGLKAAHPDKHYRYVNVDDAEKAQGRIEDGYKAVSEEECEKHGARSEIGSTRLMELPREERDRRTEEIRQNTIRRLKASRADVHAAAEAVSKELRDRHGIDLPVDRLFVDEGQ